MGRTETQPPAASSARKPAADSPPRHDPARSVRISKVDLLVALSAQGDQVLLGIIAKQTTRLDMVDLEITQRPAALAPPSVSLEHSQVQSLVRLRVEP